MSVQQSRKFRPGGLVLMLIGMFLGGALFALSASVSAGEGEDDALPPVSGEEREALRERVFEKVRQGRRVYMAEALQLDEKTSDALEAVLDAHHDEMFAAKREVHRIRAEIAQALEAGTTSEERYRELEQQHLDAIAAVSRLKVSVYEASRAILTAEQQARLQLALPAFERHVEHHVRKARKDKQDKGAPLPHGGP